MSLILKIYFIFFSVSDRVLFIIYENCVIFLHVVFDLRFYFKTRPEYFHSLFSHGRRISACKLI